MGRRATAGESFADVVTGKALVAFSPETPFEEERDKQFCDPDLIASLRSNHSICR